MRTLLFYGINTPRWFTSERCLKKGKRWQTHVFRMTSDFNWICVFVQGDAARLGNFAVTQRSVCHRSVCHKDWKKMSWKTGNGVLDQPFCFCLPYMTGLEKRGHVLSRGCVSLRSDGGCLRCPFFSPSLFVRLNVENVATPKKGIFQEKELFRCCSPVVLLWQPDWHEACGGPAQRLYWLYRWL